MCYYKFIYDCKLTAGAAWGMASSIFFINVITALQIKEIWFTLFILK